MRKKPLFQTQVCYGYIPNNMTFIGERYEFDFFTARSLDCVNHCFCAGVGHGSIVFAVESVNQYVFEYVDFVVGSASADWDSRRENIGMTRKQVPNPPMEMPITYTLSASIYSFKV